MPTNNNGNLFLHFIGLAFVAFFLSPPVAAQSVKIVLTLEIQVFPAHILALDQFLTQSISARQVNTASLYSKSVNMN
jgi:hypothetical protein